LQTSLSHDDEAKLQAALSAASPSTYDGGQHAHG
jgi:uncharacterized membrane protein